MLFSKENVISKDRECELSKLEQGAPTSKTRRSTCRSLQTNQMDSADVLYAATQLFPTCNITIAAESYRPRLGMYEVSKLQAWEVHSLKVIITLFLVKIAFWEKSVCCLCRSSFVSR